MTNATNLVAMKQAAHVIVRRSFTARKQNPGDHTKARSSALSKEKSSRKGHADVSFVARKDIIAK